MYQSIRVGQVLQCPFWEEALKARLTGLPAEDWVSVATILPTLRHDKQAIRLCNRITAIREST
jgi:hypothetical protein